MSLQKVRYISLKKVTNFLKLRLSYRLSAKKEKRHFATFPVFISVEPANYCQLHCPECPIGQKGTAKDNKNLLDSALYYTVINELKPYLTHVIFYFQGEPLLNKGLAEMIRYAHDEKIYTSTSTNAQLLTDKTAKELVESGLDKLIISMDGITQEVYEQYRVGGKLDKVLNGLENVVKWKKALKSATPFIEIQFLVLRTNEHQMDEMKAFFKKSGADKLSFKTAQLYDFENGHPLLTTQKKYTRYEQREDGKYYIKAKQPNRCWRLWSGAVINSSGDVLPCCFDKNSDFVFGNLTEKSFAECWHNKKASDLRSGILQNRKQYEICRNCTS